VFIRCHNVWYRDVGFRRIEQNYRTRRSFCKEIYRYLDMQQTEWSKYRWEETVEKVKVTTVIVNYWFRIVHIGNEELGRVSYECR
jgi:hypothetical protein